MKSLPSSESAKLSNLQNPRNRGVDADSGALLGKNANLQLRPPLKKLDAKGLAKRHLRDGIRFEMQDVARSLVVAAAHDAGMAYGDDFHRVASCRWQRIGSYVAVKADGDRVKLGGLFTCTNVWACPLCAAVIQERRRPELIQLVAWANHNWLQAAMITLTFPHQVEDRLQDLLERQAEALVLFRKGRGWERLKKFSRYRGHVRSLELTTGDNGWHPHTHELYIVAHDVDQARFTAEVREQWESACIRAGLLDLSDLRQVLAFRDHAVDIRFDCKDSDYIAKQDDSRKWGIDHEVAKASTKAGRRSGVHPHGLLLQAGAGDTAAGERYIEFITAMKGKNQLRWSRGLKAACGLEDVTDAELVEATDVDEILLCLLDSGNWSRVQRLKARRLLVEAGERALLAGGPPAAQAILGVFLAGLQAGGLKAAGTAVRDFLAKLAKER